LKTVLLHGKTRHEDTVLITKLNELNTELKGKNKTIIKMKGITDSFKGKLELWKTRLMKGVLTHFPSIQSHTDGIYEVSMFCVLTNY
jgi:hypothetical protein